MKISTLQKLKIPRLIYIPKISGLIYKLVSSFENCALRHLKNRYGLNTTTRKTKIVVSVTTYADRINIVHLTLRTLLNQTVKPDKIILWLSQDEFNDDILPKDLLALKKYGVEIKYCPDLRSHKKYYYTMLEYPKDVIITFDDDIIYPENQIEKLVSTHEKFPQCIVANEVSKLSFDSNYQLQYTAFRCEGDSSFGLSPEMMLLPIGCGGVLYPPESLHKELFNVEAIKELAFLVDDLWLKSMAMKNRIKAVKTEKWIRTLSCVKGSQKSNLAQTNCLAGNNKTSMSKIIQQYPELKDIIDNHRNI